jgi:hypothetical protein
MSIIARDFEHIDEFTSALLATGAFKDVVPLEQRPRPEDGTIAAQIEGLYYPLAAAPATSRPVAAPPTPAESRP